MHTNDEKCSLFIPKNRQLTTDRCSELHPLTLAFGWTFLTLVVTFRVATLEAGEDILQLHVLLRLFLPVDQSLGLPQRIRRRAIHLHFFLVSYLRRVLVSTQTFLSTKIFKFRSPFTIFALAFRISFPETLAKLAIFGGTMFRLVSEGAKKNARGIFNSRRTWRGSEWPLEALELRLLSRPRGHQLTGESQEIQSCEKREKWGEEFSRFSIIGGGYFMCLHVLRNFEQLLCKVAKLNMGHVF